MALRLTIVASFADHKLQMMVLSKPSFGSCPHSFLPFVPSLCLGDLTYFALSLFSLSILPFDPFVLSTSSPPLYLFSISFSFFSSSFCSCHLNSSYTILLSSSFSFLPLTSLLPLTLLSFLPLSPFFFPLFLLSSSSPFHPLFPPSHLPSSHLFFLPPPSFLSSTIHSSFSGTLLFPPFSFLSANQVIFSRFSQHREYIH